VARHSRGHAQSNSPSHTTDGQTVVQPHVLSFAVRTANTSANGWGVSGEVAHTLDLANGQSVCVTNATPNVICTTGDITHAQALDGSDVVGSLLARADGSPCVDRGQPAVLAHNHADVVGTLDFGGHGGSYNGQDAYTGRIFPSAGRPRRLTPLECERLMGWPDQHTAHGVKEDGTAYALSDTARYRLCGNGVGTPVAAWIAGRLMAEEAACPIP